MIHYLAIRHGGPPLAALYREGVLVVFVHGWGVKGANYGVVPEYLKAHQSAIEIWLADYISYDNDVTMDDLAAAFERARLEHFPDQPFACVTHSTGGPVVRAWARKYRGPLTHLVMLAPPNHGSALAQLGKGRLARMHFWVRGMEPGERVLDWLELGSSGSRELVGALPDVREYVLTGASIDRKLYDHLNSYTGEYGSDGVVRAASANLNCAVLSLRQNGAGTLDVTGFERHEGAAFGMVPGTSHSGERMGILHSVKAAEWVDACLRGEATLTCDAPRCSMIVFRVTDSHGAPVNDFDLLLTSGANYSPDRLPKGFFLDRQRNQRERNVVTYFLDYGKMAKAAQLGFLVCARPDEGPVSFAPAEFRSDLATVTSILRPHETLYVDVTLNRRREARVFAIKRRG